MFKQSMFEGSRGGGGGGGGEKKGNPASNIGLWAGDFQVATRACRNDRCHYFVSSPGAIFPHLNWAGGGFPASALPVAVLSGAGTTLSQYLSPQCSALEQLATATVPCRSPCHFDEGVNTFPDIDHTKYHLWTTVTSSRCLLPATDVTLLYSSISCQ